MSTPNRMTVVERAASRAASIASRLRGRFLLAEYPPGSARRAWEWDGKVWRQTSVDLVDGAIEDESLADGDAPTSEYLRHLKARVKRLLTVVEPPFPNKAWEINTPDGIFDLKTGKLRPHDPAARHDKITAASIRPQPRDGAWVRFMERLVPDPDMRREFQRGLGISLLGSNPANRFYILRADGGNGKTTALMTFGKAMGSYAHTLSATAFTEGETHPTGVASLEGVRFCRLEELPAGRRLAIERLKDITGSGIVSARRMRGDYFEFEVTATLFSTANEDPDLPMSDSGLRRRVAFILTTPDKLSPNEVPALRDALDADLEGALWWAYEGLRDWMADRAWVCPTVLEINESRATEENPLYDFLSEWTVRDPGCWTSVADLHDAYVRWCEQRGWRESVSTIGFGRHMRKLGFVSKLRWIDKTKQRVYYGIRLKGVALEAIGKAIVTPVTDRELEEHDDGAEIPENR